MDRFATIVLKIKDRLIKTLSVVLSGALVFTSVQSTGAMAPSVAIKSSVNLSTLSIPSDLAFITDAYRSASDNRLVVLLQDLHVHEETQKKIRGILDFLFQRPDFKEVGVIGLEGAGGAIPPVPAANKLSVQVKHKISDFLIKEGELTGAEAYVIEKDREGLLWGVEKENYYGANRELYLMTLAARKELQKRLQYLDERLANVVKRFKQPASIKDVIRLEKALEDGTAHPSLVLRRWLKQGADMPLKMHPYPRLSALANVIEVEDKNLQPALQEEARQFLSVLVPYLVVSERRELEMLAKGDPALFYLRLAWLARERHVEELLPPTLKGYLQGLSGIRDFSLFDLTQELLTFAPEFKALLATDRASQNAFLAQRSIRFLNRFLTQQATDYEVTQWSTNLREMIARVKALGILTPQEVDELVHRINNQIDFYHLALMRNAPMVENLLAEMQNRKTAKGILVAGGFHTRGLADALRKNNVSYLVITPSIQGDLTPEYTALYEARLADQHITSEEIEKGVHQTLGIPNAMAIALFFKNLAGKIFTRHTEIRDQAFAAGVHTPAAASPAKSVETSPINQAVSHDATSDDQQVVFKPATKKPSKRWQLRHILGLVLLVAVLALVISSAPGNEMMAAHFQYVPATADQAAQVHMIMDAQNAFVGHNIVPHNYETFGDAVKQVRLAAKATNPDYANFVTQDKFWAPDPQGAVFRTYHDGSTFNEAVNKLVVRGNITDITVHQGDVFDITKLQLPRETLAKLTGVDINSLPADPYGAFKAAATGSRTPPDQKILSSDMLLELKKWVNEKLVDKLTDYWNLFLKAGGKDTELDTFYKLLAQYLKEAGDNNFSPAGWIKFLGDHGYKITESETPSGGIGWKAIAWIVGILAAIFGTAAIFSPRVRNFVREKIFRRPPPPPPPTTPPTPTQPTLAQYKDNLNGALTDLKAKTDPNTISLADYKAMKDRVNGIRANPSATSEPAVLELEKNIADELMRWKIAALTNAIAQLTTEVTSIDKSQPLDPNLSQQLANRYNEVVNELASDPKIVDDQAKKKLEQGMNTLVKRMRQKGILDKALNEDALVNAIKTQLNVIDDTEAKGRAQKIIALLKKLRDLRDNLENVKKRPADGKALLDAIKDFSNDLHVLIDKTNKLEVNKVAPEEFGPLFYTILDSLAELAKKDPYVKYKKVGDIQTELTHIEKTLARAFPDLALARKSAAITTEEAVKNIYEKLDKLAEDLDTRRQNPSKDYGVQTLWPFTAELSRLHDEVVATHPQILSEKDYLDRMKKAGDFVTDLYLEASRAADHIAYTGTQDEFNHYFVGGWEETKRVLTALKLLDASKDAEITNNIKEIGRAYSRRAALGRMEPEVVEFRKNLIQLKDKIDKNVGDSIDADHNWAIGTVDMDALQTEYNQLDAEHKRLLKNWKGDQKIKDSIQNQLNEIHAILKDLREAAKIMADIYDTAQKNKIGNIPGAAITPLQARINTFVANPNKSGLLSRPKLVEALNTALKNLKDPGKRGNIRAPNGNVNNGNPSKTDRSQRSPADIQKRQKDVKKTWTTSLENIEDKMKPREYTSRDTYLADLLKLFDHSVAFDIPGPLTTREKNKLNALVQELRTLVRKAQTNKMLQTKFFVPLHLEIFRELTEVANRISDGNVRQATFNDLQEVLDKINEVQKYPSIGKTVVVKWLEKLGGIPTRVGQLIKRMAKGKSVTPIFLWVTGGSAIGLAFIAAALASPGAIASTPYGLAILLFLSGSFLIVRARRSTAQTRAEEGRLAGLLSATKLPDVVDPVNGNSTDDKSVFEKWAIESAA